MRRAVVALFLLAALPLAAAPPRRIVLEGTAYERGVTHGRLLKTDIRELVRRWGDDIRERLGIAPEDFARRFLAETKYVDAIRGHTPDLLDEVRGIADGAGIPFDTMLVFQLGDEMWTEGDAIAKHCTSIGVDRRGTQPAIVAQNLDIETFYGGFVIVIDIRGDGPEQLVLSYPGLIGLNGVNRDAIGLCTNTIEHLAGARDGLPQAFVVRGVLRQRTFAHASRFLHSVRHASGQNYVIGDRDHAVSFEASANVVVPVPPQRRGCTFHTNYPLANDDLRDEIRRGKTPEDEGRERYAAVDRRVKAAPSLAVVKETLRSRDDAKHPVSRESTFASTIMLLRDAPELLVAPGRPDASRYVRFTFRTAAVRTQTSTR